MSRNLAYLAIIVIIAGTVIAAAPTISSAAFSQQKTQLNTQAMQAEYDRVLCQSNLTVSFINEITATVPNSSTTLDPMSTALQNDVAQLKNYSAGTNITLFRSYIRGAYNPELSSISTATTAALKSVNTTTRKSLRSQYATLKTTYQSCSVTALNALGQKKLQYYQDAFAMYRTQIAQLSAKGIATAQLNSTLQSANTTIYVPLQNALDSATNASQARSAINSYCMFDGCPGNGTNFHLAAKFDSEKLQAIIDKLDTMNLTSNSVPLLADAQADVNNATSVLQSVGDARYKNGQLGAIWNNLGKASKLLSQINFIVKHSSSGANTTVATTTTPLPMNITNSTTKTTMPVKNVTNQTTVTTISNTTNSSNK